MNSLIKKLVINALKGYLDERNNSSCNDLFSDDPLLKKISKEELEQLRLLWVENCPEEAKELEYELVWDTSVLETLIKLIEKE